MALFVTSSPFHSNGLCRLWFVLAPSVPFRITAGRDEGPVDHLCTRHVRGRQTKDCPGADNPQVRHDI